VELQEQMYAHFERARDLNNGAKARPRSAVLVRRSTEEAKRIRRAAQARAMTFSGYILRALHRSWDVARTIPELFPHPQPHQS